MYRMLMWIKKETLTAVYMSYIVEVILRSAYIALMV